MSYVLGIDLGTSSLKGILVDNHGKVVSTSSSDYPLIHLQPGYSEQDPKQWINACETVILNLSKEVADFLDKLEGISFSGQMHSLVVLDNGWEILRNAILWNDVRTTKECQRITKEFGEELLRITKNKALEGFTLPKILWLQANEPEIWEKVAHILLPKDYLGFWMTGKAHMDYSDAAGTLLLDVASRTWSEKILEKFSISENILPKLANSYDLTGELRPELCERFGFKNGVKIFAGGADNACAAIGAGILSSEVGMASIGTSGVFLACEDSPDIDYHGDLHLFNHARKESYYSMGVTLSAGHSLNWFRDTFATEMSFENLLADINEIPAGSDGLLFTPYIMGERTPYSDSKIRGSFIGIDTNHTLKHFAKAVVEGITFSLQDIKTLMENIASKDFKKIVSVGGGAKNKDWLQIQANVFNAEVMCLETEQGPGMGAAMIAAVGLGWFDCLEACAEKFVAYTESVFPQAAKVKEYAEVYKIYTECYPATAKICHELQSLSIR